MIHPPSCPAYTLNLTNSHLILTFSDVVNISTQFSPALRLQSGETASLGALFTLSEDSLSYSDNGHIVDISLSDLDILTINSIEGLAKNETNTYLIMRADYIDDYQGGDVLPITDGKAQRVTTFIPDRLPPNLLYLTLDLNTQSLNLTFDDTISLNNIDLASIGIQNERKQN